MRDSGASIASGFGGLRLEGIVGSEESLGASSEPPGEGNRGVISGESAGNGGEDNGGFGSNAGAAEIVEAGTFLGEVLSKVREEEKEWQTKKIMSIIKNGFLEVKAINDDEMNGHPFAYSWHRNSKGIIFGGKNERKNDRVGIMIEGLSRRM